MEFPRSFLLGLKLSKPRRLPALSILICPVVQLAALVRWNAWYNSKLPLYLVAISYAALRRGASDGTLLADLVSLVILFCLYASFGHIVNDYSDLEVDR